jgi:hypothetical protein
VGCFAPCPSGCLAVIMPSNVNRHPPVSATTADDRLIVRH